MFYGQKIDGEFADKKILEVFPYLNKKNGFFIECGAADGIIDSSCKYFEESLNWKGINIEPFDCLYKKLIKNRPNSINVFGALSNKIGEVNFASTLHTYIGCGSINGPNDYLKSKIKDNKKIIYSKVKTITYEYIINKYNITKIDLFVLDIEGHELEVINDMKKCSILPDTFVIEYGHVGLEKINNSVYNLGYKFIINDSVNSFYEKK